MGCLVFLCLCTGTDRFSEAYENFVVEKFSYAEVPAAKYVALNFFKISYKLFHVEHFELTRVGAHFFAFISHLKKFRRGKNFLASKNFPAEFFS